MAQGRNIHVEVPDFVLVTALVAHLIGRMRNQWTIELGPSKGEIDQETITQLVSYWGVNSALTLGAGRRDITKSMSYAASVFGIYRGRSRRRKYNYSGTGPTYPEIRGKHDHYGHRPKSELLQTICETKTILNYITETLAQLRCTYRTPDGVGFSTLGGALVLTTPAFCKGEFLIRSRIADCFEVIGLNRGIKDPNTVRP